MGCNVSALGYYHAKIRRERGSPCILCANKLMMGMQKAQMEKQKEETMYHDIGEKSFSPALNYVNH
jgi:hypothetical protein